jgi:hypothetical protein
MHKNTTTIYYYPSKDVVRIFSARAVKKLAYKFVTIKILWICASLYWNMGAATNSVVEQPTLNFWLCVYFGTCTCTSVLLFGILACSKTPRGLVLLETPCQLITLYNLNNCFCLQCCTYDQIKIIFVFICHTKNLKVKVQKKNHNLADYVTVYAKTKQCSRRWYSGK